MDVMDYLIDLEGKDWAELLSGWRFLLPQSFNVWLVNRVGDVFAVFPDDSVHMLDVGRGTLERVADSCDDFVTRIDQDDHRNTWMMVSLVDACRKAGLTIGPNQCYGFKIPPMLGGSYEVENMEPTDLSVHYTLLGEICEQTKDLPRGTTVKRIEIKEP
ncbi:MAG: DUF1851 domain-containing protein [Terracidiphilus sp.]